MSDRSPLYEWRYLPHGLAVHALAFPAAAGAVCGVYTLPPSNWRGTGSQAEYDRAAKLPCCRRCLRLAARRVTR